MSSQPSTPFIPPLHSTGSSPNPQPAPVIPGPGGNTGSSYPFFAAGGGYPAYSPHSSGTPFIPPSPNTGFIPPTPGPPPPAAAPAAAAPPRGHSRGPPSHDYGAFTPGHPGAHPSPYGQQPPTLAPSMSYFGQHTPYAPPAAAFSPYGPTPHSAPAMYPPGMQTPWGPPAMSPYGPMSGGMPPPGWGPPNPYASPIPPPGAQMGGWPGFPPPGPMQRGASGPQDSWFGGGGQPPRARAEPPPQVNDRMDKFTPGGHYYPVLDPFLAKVVNARIFINPLIGKIPEDGVSGPHLNWNMLFPTSNVHRSDTPTHLSWSNGREAPATFPRISSMRLVSEHYPWIISVQAKDKDYGVTCGEVIEAIGYDMYKMAHQSDFNNVPARDRNDLSQAYRMNRSREGGGPGGMLGNGLKHLDFLRRNTIFGGVEVDHRVVQAKCGDVLPCVFVLHCSRSFPMTKQDIKDNEMRARSAAQAQASGSGARSRANSNARITVQSPTTSTTDTDDDPDYDR